jgi:hypothetical protein
MTDNNAWRNAFFFCIEESSIKNPSRLALKRAVEEFCGQEISEDIAIKDHLHLDKYPDVLASISHTKSIGAALLGRSPELLSIGLDLEVASRPIEERAKKFFLNNDDAPLSLLELWCLKEAIFKALDPVKTYFNLNGPVLFTNLIVDSFKWHHANSNVCGECRLEKIMSPVSQTPLIKAMAWIKRNR